MIARDLVMRMLKEQNTANYSANICAPTAVSDQCHHVGKR
jgi:hypothetical protein